MMIHEYDIIKTFYEVDREDNQAKNKVSSRSEELEKLRKELLLKENKITELIKKLTLANTENENLKEQINLPEFKAKLIDFDKRCLFDDILAN